MTRTTTTCDRVSLSPSDWLGLATIALGLFFTAGATLWQVYDLAATSRERLAIVETKVDALVHRVEQIESRWE